MCGIAGYVNTAYDNSAREDVVRRMCDAMVHRGPDDDGYYVKNNVGLGMRRLSIIDLHTGKQPIANEDESAWIIFNGEIYNFPVLRSELEARGHKFRTKTDTETILHAYEEWGTDCPNKLNGMFAFAIWDERRQQLFIARDRLGIKPLYYYLDNDRFVFGSELKAVVQHQQVPRALDHEALDLFLTYEYVPAPHSILRDIKKLPAGHSLVWRKGAIEIRRFWELHFNENGRPSADLQRDLIDLLQDAVKIRLIADVPLGAFLSGGIDSSTIVALMSRVMDQPVKTFSIGFEDSTYNELEYARTIARHYKTDHTEFIIKPDALELTEKLVYSLDEPFGDFSIFPTYLVSKMAREHVTVVLSGDGGDELFGGYDTYVADWTDRTYRRYVPALVREKMVAPLVSLLPPTDKKKGFINKSRRFVEGSALPADLQHTRWMTFLQEAEKPLLYHDAFLGHRNGDSAYQLMRDYFRRAGTNDRINQQSYVDIKTYLCDDILVKVDRMSMATSLEARVPFLDYRVVEFSGTVPGHLKLQGNKTKVILKQAIRELVPDEIITRGKEGFSIPIKNWLKKELKPIMLDVLSSERLQRDQLFRPQYVERLIKEHLDGRENHSHRLWALMVFHIWKDIYLGR